MITAKQKIFSHEHCLKSVRIRNYSGPYFPAFGKIRTRITPNTDTFDAVELEVIFMDKVT